jgi:hypothetical protein
MIFLMMVREWRNWTLFLQNVILMHIMAGKIIKQLQNRGKKHLKFLLATGLVVLQHLLIGMNAHINLDLGIAAAEISKNKNIDDLQDDFMRINEILSSLVNEVQNNLAEIWPTLKKILQKTNKADDFLVDFSMKLARDGAWKFAKTISETPENHIDKFLKDRDEKIAEKAGLVINPGFVANLIFKIIRLGEKGTVASKINQLAKTIN